MEGDRLPPGSKSGEYLSHYAKRFDTVEIDATGYRIPSETLVRNWDQEASEGFVFSAKVPSVITHEKRLVGCDGELQEFLRVMDLLGPGFGPLVLQFRYDFKPDQFDVLSRSLEGLPAGFPFALAFVLQPIDVFKDRQGTGPGIDAFRQDSERRETRVDIGPDLGYWSSRLGGLFNRF